MSDYVVVIAARMTSTRLPGKALATYCPNGMTNLEQIVRRWWTLSRREPQVIVATTTDDDDDPIDDLCDEIGVDCYRGPRDDVVERIDGAIVTLAPYAKYIARGMSDSPLVDVRLADWRRDVLAETGADATWYGGDDERLTYAATTDIWSRAAWDRIAYESRGQEREHAGLYMWDHMDKFDLVQLPLPWREYLSQVRTELDTPEDLAMFTALWEVWHAEQPFAGEVLTTLDALRILAERPDIAARNAQVVLKTQTRPSWRRGSQWLCKACRRRVGSVIAGDLQVRCARCGKPQKFYALSPAGRK